MKSRNIAITTLLGLVISASASAQWFDQKIIRDAAVCATNGNCVQSYASRDAADYNARMAAQEQTRMIIAAQAQTAQAKKEPRPAESLAEQKKHDTPAHRAEMAARVKQLNDAMDKARQAPSPSNVAAPAAPADKNVLY